MIPENVPNQIRSAASVNSGGDVRWGTESVTGVSVRGQSTEWPDYSPGDFVAGRNFLPAEEQGSSPVVVVTADLAESLFGAVEASGR